MKKYILGIAALAAALTLFAGAAAGGGSTTSVSALEPVPTATPIPPPPPPALGVAVACSPLTNSQRVSVGDSQYCRVRIRNTSTSTITGITYSRPTPNTLTSRTPLRASYGITCDLGGCDPFDLAPGASVIIKEYSTFNPSQDSRGKTTATATGTLNGETITASGTEQSSLP